MSSSRHTDNDGSDIFWPGYVDAVTNLVLNLLFLLTIMTVAVFMFALELGRASKGEPNKATEVVSKVTSDPVKENLALKREIQRLHQELALRDALKAESVKPGGPAQTVEATLGAPQPQSGLDKAVATDMEIVVRFLDEAVTFTAEEHARLLETLKPIVANGKANISVEVPLGFSEAKRMGFYRAMAVRNLLIEMKLPQDNINVSVVEGRSNANASIVKVR